MEVRIGPVAITGPGLLMKTAEDDYVHVPDPIPATVLDADWDLELEIRIDTDTLEPYIDAMTVRRKEGGPKVTPDMIRGVRLGEALREAVRKASTRWIKDGNVMRMDFDVLDRRTAKKAFARPAHTVTRDDIEQAVDAYTRAQCDGRRDVLVAVAEACHISRATAHRRIAKAREIGLLNEGPAD
jgi:hypothetical protein